MQLAEFIEKYGSTGIVERRYPGLKDAKRGTILDNFEFHVFFVSITISPANDVFGLEVRALDKTQRKFMIAISEDAIEMFVDHFGKTAIGFKPSPFQRVFPILPEFQSPSSGFKRPQMIETFFQEMSPAQTRRSEQEFVQGFSGFASDMSQTREQDEFFTRQQTFDSLIDPKQFLIANFVKRIQQMSDDVEFIEENDDFRTMSLETINESFPHIHDHHFNRFGSLYSKPFPESLEVFFLSSLVSMSI